MGGHDGVIFLMKVKSLDRTQDMGNLFKENFESALPATEATVLNVGNDDKKSGC